MPAQSKVAIDENSNLFRLLKALYSIIIDYHNYYVTDKIIGPQSANNYAKHEEPISDIIDQIILRVEDKTKNENRIDLLKYIKLHCLELQNIMHGNQPLSADELKKLSESTTQLFLNFNTILHLKKNERINVTKHEQNTSILDTFALWGTFQGKFLPYCAAGNIINKNIFQEFELKTWKTSQPMDAKCKAFINTLCEEVNKRDQQIQAAASSSSTAAILIATEEKPEAASSIASSSSEFVKEPDAGSLNDQLVLELEKKQIKEEQKRLAEEREQLERERAELRSQKKSLREKESNLRLTATGQLNSHFSMYGFPLGLPAIASRVIGLSDSTDQFDDPEETLENSYSF